MSSPKIPNPIFQSVFFKKMGRTVSLSNLEAWDCIQNLTFPKSQWTTLKFIEKQSEMILSYQQCLITLIYILPGPTVTNFPQVNIASIMIFDLKFIYALFFRGFELRNVLRHLTILVTA